MFPWEDPNWNGGSLYQAILMFAGGKRYLMRAPLRLWHEIYWLNKFGENNDKHWTARSTNKVISRGLKDKLKRLEQFGYIRRFPGGIEIMENIYE